MPKNSQLAINSLNFFFLLMLILPASFQGPRGAFLAVIFLSSLRFDLPVRLLYDKNIIYLGIFNVLASVSFVINGLILAAPGAIKVSTVFVIWPVLYLYFIGYNWKTKDILPYMKTMLYGCLISCILILLFIINTLVPIPGIEPFAAAQDFSVGFYDGFIELNSMNLATILYAFSFCLTILLLPKPFNYFSSGKMRFLTILCFVSSVLLILISARRAFWVICLICPMIIVVVFKVSNIKIRLIKYLGPIFGFILFTAVAFYVLEFDISSFTREFDTIFEFDNPAEGSNYIRKEQYDALMSGWEKYPVLGNGLGAAASRSVRDEVEPWAYELSYIALLFQTGMIGIMIYVSSVLWIYYKAIKIMRSDGALAVFMLAPQLVGLTSFIIINASNPYLAKFDYLWTIFLPIATINAFLLNKKETVGQPLIPLT